MEIIEETGGGDGAENNCSSPAFAVLNLRDICLLLADKYLDNLGDVMSLARVCRRTREILENHPEIIGARNDYRTFCPSRHTEPVSRQECFPCNSGFGRGRFLFSNTGLCKEHGGECKQCHPPQLAGDGIWEKRTVSYVQCHLLQRANNALYTVGNPRLALHYWNMAKLGPDARPGVRVSILVRMRQIPAIAWFADRNGRSEFVVCCDQPDKMLRSAVTPPMASFTKVKTSFT